VFRINDLRHTYDEYVVLLAKSGMTLSIHRPLGCLLLSVTFPCRERKPIARLVNFLLTSESVQLIPYTLCEACLKSVCLVDELF
jgi:hypothetical protein